MSTLHQMTGEFVYNIYKEEYPNIVKFIQTALKAGMTPSRIHDAFKQQLGKNSATATHIGLVADYLKENPQS